MTRTPPLLVMVVLATGCPVRPLPCNSDGDCDYPRNACDTTKPVGEARGTCVFRLLARQGDEPAPSSLAEGSSSSGSSSSSTECTVQCAPGQRCVNNLCVCDDQSCQGGCCQNNQCTFIGFATCAQPGDTCLTCDDWRADNCAMSGACRCGNKQACSTGQLCIRGSCECYPANCPGCCDGTECRERSAEACGVNGSVCLPCNPIKADGCSPEGVCRCGNGPPCGLYKACISGNCVCDGERCPGCCENRVCVLASMVACGTGGEVCQQCDAKRADACGNSGECTCGIGPACVDGQACVGGRCVCTQGSCSGCCNGNVCEPGLANERCGVAGLVCEACAGGELCTDGVCARCNSFTCPDGCCSANTCYPLNDNTCGFGGKACEYCSPIQADSCSPEGSCRCGDGAPCTEGQECINNSCTCSPTSCPFGCCQDGECQERSAVSCGMGGALCSRCDVTSTDYCSPAGVCQCGSDLPCASGLRCVDGACLCDTQTCPQGCCQGDECVQATMQTCGTQGGVCVPCPSSLSDTCLADGTCACGSRGACQPGTTCQSGQCVCTPDSCPTGCCSAEGCMAATRDTCGIGGAACQACGTNADGCGADGTCHCGMGTPCVNDEWCVEGRCVSGGSSSSGSLDSSSGTSSSASAGDSASASASSVESTSSTAATGTTTSSPWSGSSATPSSAPGNSTSTMQSSSSADTTPPGQPVVSVSSPTNNARPAWSWVSGGGGNGTYRYKLDDGDLTVGATEIHQPSFTPTVDLGEGSHTLYVQERDDAGNWSGSGSASVLIDRTPPEPPQLTASTPSSPANHNEPVITGTAEDDGTVRIYANETCTGTELSIGSAAELADPGLMVTVADDSTTTFHATATDTAGNVSDCSQSSLVYVEDSTPPALVTFIGSTPASPANENTPLIQGTAEPGTTVQLFTSAACTGEVVATGSSDDFMTPGLPVTVEDDSVVEFWALSVDGVGNPSACSATSIMYMEDSTPPAAVVLAGTQPASPADDNHPRILGTAEAGTTVSVFTNNTCSGSPVATGDSAQFANPGLTVDVTEGSRTTFWANARDAAGNLSDCSMTSVSYQHLFMEFNGLWQGGHHSCAQHKNGAVKCWGNNDWGQLGLSHKNNMGDLPTEMGVDLPVLDLGAGAVVKSMGLGFWHSCAALMDGRVKCWGRNAEGQLGLGDTQPRGDGPDEMGDALPAVDLGTGVLALSVTAGWTHSCALITDGRVKCWGENGIGQLGLGDKVTRGTTADTMGDALPFVDLGTNVVAMSLVSRNRHTCVVLVDGRVKCWGDNWGGKLGLGDTQARGDGSGEMGDDLPFTDLGVGLTAHAVGVGSNHSCALLDTLQLKCWGNNGSTGQLGLEDLNPRGDGPGEMGDALPFVNVGTGATVESFTSGLDFNCVITSTGTTKCWGYSGLGEGGRGEKTNRGGYPGEMGDALQPVDLGSNARADMLSSFGNGNCARLTDGRLKCWGWNGASQLGLGDTNNRGDDPGEMGDNLPATDLGW